jgi:rubredoxin
MERYKCGQCSYIYDPEAGEPLVDIEPGTSFSKLPEDYICPICGAGKEDFFIYE